MTAIILTFFGILLAPVFVSGIKVKSWTTALGAAVVLSFFNITLKPIMIVLTIPVTIITLGFFVLIINMLLYMLVSKLFSGFTVSSWGAAFWGALIITIIKVFFG